MAAIHDLLAQVQDETLRERLEQEINKLTKTKKFGLVFEEHIPECTPLYDVPVKRGGSVAKRAGAVNIVYEVSSIKDGIAICVNKVTQEKEQIPMEDLVSVAEFGEPIYPYLKPIDSVCNAPDSDLWHTLIEADNYHALQLLEYLYAGKVDCIYIDPPYNTGAKDWKYNNNYVDGSDEYRHSKWLSMMQKRLKLAKKLLNSTDSVLIVSIDEKEYLHLGCLLEELFPEAHIQMVSDMINRVVVARDNEFGRSCEYLFIVFIGTAAPERIPLEEDWNHIENTTKDGIHWANLSRTGTNSRRVDRPGMFYPIFVSEDGKRITGLGDVIPLEQDRNTVKAPDGSIAVWPIHSNGTEGRWMQGKESLAKLINKGYVRLGRFTETGMAVSYLNRAQIKKIEAGDYTIEGYDESGTVIVDDSNYSATYIPDTQWNIKSHDAARQGTNLLLNILQSNRFSFPKSLYAVHDVLRFFVKSKPQALILDFFAGSGTTLQAINLLNAEDGGQRRCILVTNNEVSVDEAKILSAQGFNPGDPEWEKLGIARYVTWPRTVCSIEGHDVNGKPLKGNYLGSDIPMSEGFQSNAIFFKLGFLDKTSVALGRQLAELFPVLWMKAGAHGPCPELANESAVMEILPENRFAILIDERYFAEFEVQLACHPEIDTLYFVTDSDAGYREMISKYQTKETFQLYKDYLDNFRINTRR
jgi:adenine-specific DNA-methyltransferase